MNRAKTRCARYSAVLGRHCTGYRVRYRADRTPEQSRRNAKHLPGIGGLSTLRRQSAVCSLSASWRTAPQRGVLIHEKSSLAPPGQSLAFSLGDEKGFWVDRGLWHYRWRASCRDGHRQDREQDRTGANAHSGTACGRKAYAERRTGKGSQWAWDFLTHHENGKEPYRGQTCDRERRHSMGLLSPRLTTGTRQKHGKDGKVFIDTLMLPPCLVPSYRHRPMMNSHRAFFIYRRILNEQYRNQHRHLPDCQKADWQDHLYRPCPFQRDRHRDDGGQNQAYAPWGSPQNVTSFWIWWKSPWLFVSGKTAKSILISCGARLAPFDIQELRDLMAEDELELDTLGDRKTAACFVIISDTDATFNFVVSIMYSQLFNLLCDKADDVYNGRLPVHVRMLLDEFANIGQIPQFEKLIATIRSREISASIILQSKSQLKAIYKDNADTIEGQLWYHIIPWRKGKDYVKRVGGSIG